MGLSHLWIPVIKCSVAWGSALSRHKEQSCGGWWAKSKSPPVPGGKAGCFLANLSPLLQYVGSKSILRRPETGQSALQYSDSPQHWLSWSCRLGNASVQQHRAGFSRVWGTRRPFLEFFQDLDRWFGEEVLKCYEINKANRFNKHLFVFCEQNYL